MFCKTLGSKFEHNYVFQITANEFVRFKNHIDEILWLFLSLYDDNKNIFKCKTAI